MKNKTLFPAIHGFKIGLGVENFEPWNDRELSSIMYHLQGEDSDSVDLLHESCSPEEADAIMNPGTDTVYEAVTAIYNRLDSTAKALARVFSRNLSSGLSIDGEPYVGPDRRNALFAYKTVTLSTSDGQTISILFHSPDDNPRKFTPSETLIAYRFMLNKKDITATVAPVRGVELTLNIMASRMAQLLEANSPKFVKANEDREAVANELAEVSASREALLGKVAETIDKEAAIDSKIAEEEKLAARLVERLTEAKERNDKLKAKAAEAANASPNESGFSFQINKNNAKAILKTLLEEYGKLRKSWLKRRTSNQYIKNPNWSLAIDKTVLKHNLDYKDRNDVDFVLGKSFIPVIAMGGPKSENYAELISESFYKHLSIQQPGIYFEDDQQHIDTAPLSFDLPAGNENNDTSPDSPSSEQGFVTHNFTDRRTQVAAALAEELETAGFTPASFPIDNPDFVLAENSPVAFEQTLTGNGSVLLNSVLEDGTMNIELSYTEQSQPGVPNDSSRKEIQAKVPFGILESKFDDVVSQIEAFFMQFRTPLDDIELPAMGEKLNQEGINQHDVVEIAKAIRKDIKSILPEGFKPSFISVKTSSYSGGASINVSIKKVAEGFKVMETEKAYSREMLALIKVIKAVGDAYRYDNSDSMTDYSDTNFFYSVDADYDLRVFDQSQNEPIEPKSFSVGDTVEWINDNGTVQGIFRGFDGADNENTVLVSNGSQMIAPTSEVFPYTETAKYSSGVNDVVDAIGVDAGKLQELLDLNLGDDINLLMDVRVDRVRETISKEKAKAYFDALEGKDLSAFEVNVKAANALVSFIKTGEFKLENDEGSPADNLDGIKKEIQAITIESDSGVAIEKLESIIARAEELGVMADLEALMIDASNHITELLGKEAASA